MVLALTLLASYLIGALPFGYLVARWRGVDIFQQGSGNIGATNIGRVLGRRFGILVFLLDFAKGALPVAAASWLTQHSVTADGFLGPDGLRVGAGLAAFLGHLFPIYLRFRGGKGVATGAGVVAVLLPGPALAAFLTWLTVLCASRYMSLASLAAIVALCAIRLGTIAQPLAPENRTLTLFCFVAAGLVALRHRANIVRLCRGTENRLGSEALMLVVSKTIHVLALGLWFGTTVFFSFVVAVTLFRTFEAVGAKPRDERPLWFPLPAEFDRDAATRKEQGTRAAGAAVSPLFDPYFLIQGACGFLTLITALGWSRTTPHDRVARIRVLVLLLAVATVVAGWPLEWKVGDLRVLRNDASDVLLRSAPADADNARTVAEATRAEFVHWHLYSLLLNLVTVVLVTVAMGLAARLPDTRVENSRSPQAG